MLRKISHVSKFKELLNSNKYVDYDLEPRFGDTTSGDQ